MAVEVTVGSDVEWDIQNANGWIMVQGASSRVGPGTVTIAAEANDTVYPRSGTVTIAGKTFSVSQKARGVTVTCGDNLCFGAKTASGSFTVKPDGEVSWTAVSSDPTWIVIFGETSGTGQAEVSYVIPQYVGDGTPRTGTITVGDQVIYITQRPFDLDISPKGEWVTGNAGAGEIGVSAGISDVWSAIVTEPWIKIVTGCDSGTGDGVVRYTYDVFSRPT